MRKLTATILFAFLLLSSLALFAVGPTAAQQPTPPPAKGPDQTAPDTPPVDRPVLSPEERRLLVKIEPQLLKRLLQPDRPPAPFIVYLRAKADLKAATGSITATLGPQAASDPLIKRTVIVNTLQETARNSQSGVLELLNNPSSKGLNAQAAANVRPLWIVNAVAARGNLDLVLALAARPDVEIVRLDKKRKLERRSGTNIVNPSTPPPFHPSTLLLPQPSNPQWNITKIRADLVHDALGIDGAGVVVANIDSGVDWQHPALQATYRGYTGPGKLPWHAGNWFDATGAGAAYPVDSYGHGTHTMGSIVGHNGIGVAPGARWIAVKAFDSNGTALNSWLHGAFQWVLAPNGDPALAPNVVNNSWGSAIGSDTEFQADVQALLNAGIFPIFSAGNNGPETNTVGSPGSLPIAFSVGATDIADDIALFSSRGPSFWGQVKPDVSAPGKDITSALPGGSYDSWDGTSMAAPHVSGLAALLMQASPALSQNLTGISYAITSTAVRLGDPIPNNDYGWGRIDAYNAVMSVASVGVLQGRITQAGTNGAISDAAVQIVPRSGGVTVHTYSDSAGNYVQGLAANTYDVTATAFGYNPATSLNVQIVNGQPTTRDFSLQPLPTGNLQGVVRDSVTQLPLSATITIEGTPARTSSNPANGNYFLRLPVGVYTVTVEAARHRLARATVTINADLTTTKDFWLDGAPAILLVDSGKWYQESEIGYYQQALSDLLYPYDLLEIRQPYGASPDIPSPDALTPYDIVIWSSPRDSPGYIGAEQAIEDFLEGGGKLLLSGQDVAFFDGGSIFGGALYLRDYLKTAFVADNSMIDSITGAVDGPFAGLSVGISGGDGANNQILPDVVAVADSDFAGPLLVYEEDGLAGLHIGQCLPYRAIFLAFGFEAINSRAARSQTMNQILDWLMQPPPAAGVELTPLEETRVGNFGAVVSHTARLRNTGANHDIYQMLLNGGSWSINPPLLAPVSLPSCQSQTVILEVQVPPDVDWHTFDTLTLSAQSTNNPTLVDTVTRTTKSPAPVLLVDDDRWYSFAGVYTGTLQSNNIAYDYWLVPKSWSGPSPPSPSLETLRMYPMTVWYTGYDWYQPLTSEEEARLAAYLDQGGRLWFSSQDYIYNLPDHVPSPFARDYLGVLTHTEDYSSTVMIGEAGNPVGHRLGPAPLTFPPGYNNWTDALTPTAAARIATRGQHDQPNGLTQAGAGQNGHSWHTTFLAFGPELLPSTARNRLAQRSLGWLSWLGRSTVTPSLSAALDGSDVTYTAVILNDGWAALPTVHFTATFPSELTLGAFSAGLTPVGGDLVWQGSLARNESRVFTYSATIADSLPLGTIVSQESWLSYPDHNIVFDRVADLYVNFPDLKSSTMSVSPTEGVDQYDVLTYTITLMNTGLVDAPMVTTTNTLPAMLDFITLGQVSQGNVTVDGQTITWTAPVSRNSPATLTYWTVISYRTGSAIENRAYVDDGLSEPIPIIATSRYEVGPIYLPIISKDGN